MAKIRRYDPCQKNAEGAKYPQYDLRDLVNFHDLQQVFANNPHASCQLNQDDRDFRDKEQAPQQSTRFATGQG